VVADADGWVTLTPRATTTTLSFAVPLPAPGESVLTIEVRSANGLSGSASLAISTPLVLSAPLTPAGVVVSASTVRISWTLLRTDTPYLRGWRSALTAPSGSVVSRTSPASARSTSFYIPSAVGAYLLTFVATGVLPESAPVRFEIVRTSSGTTITLLP
jgi:hypothetical protein